MDMLLNQFLLLFLGFSANTFFPLSIMTIVSFLCAVSIATLTYVYPKRKCMIAVNICYLIICNFQLQFLCYLPLILYPFIQKQQNKVYYSIVLLPFILVYRSSNIKFYAFMSILLLCSYFLKIRSIESETIQKNYIKQRDASRELSLVLTEKNHELIIQQNQEIQIATLNERNRIAREIHDNVGHLLSSSLLQIGALQTICEDKRLSETIQNLCDTISEAMDNVRTSVHDLHDESIMLDTAIQKLIHQYHFASIHFEYDVIHPLTQCVSCHILAIVKECLTNTMKHSDASKVLIILREHPMFYQFIFHDNGTLKKVINSHGIGLKNIKERIDGLKGYVNIDNTNGFQIFITLTKEEIQNENTNS